MCIDQNWRIRVAVLLMTLIVTGLALIASAKSAYAQMDTQQIDTQWVKTLTSSQDIQLTSMSLSSAGEVVIAGTFHGTVDFDPGSGERLLSSGPSDTSMIAKYDPNGNLNWAYRLIGSGDVIIRDIVVDSTGQIGVVGSFEGSADLNPGDGLFQVTSKGGHDIFLLRLLPDGNLQWGWADGNSDDDMGFAITTDTRSALYITGKFEGKIYFQSGDSLTYERSSIGGTDIFMARFNNAGHLFWVNVIGGEEDDAGTGIGLDAQDNVFITGTFAGKIDLDPLHTSYEVRSHGRDDIFVTVMTQHGESRWATYMGGQGSESNAQILVEADGSFYVSGQFERSAEFDTYTHTGSVESRGGQDIFITRFGPAPARAFQWAYGIGGPQNETLAGIDQDGFKNLYILGTFSGAADFDPSAGTSELSSSGGTEIFLGQYTQQGALRQVKAMVNPQDDHARALAISNSNNVLFGGEFSGSIDLGSGLTASTGKPAGVFDLFMAQYTRDTWVSLPTRSYLPGISSAVIAN